MFEKRKKNLAEEKRCFKCMKTGHTAVKCRSSIKCFKCDGKHHTTICTKIMTPIITSKSLTGTMTQMI